MGAGRPKGYKKTGGRVAGTPNRASLQVAELCAFHNCSPAEILIDFATTEDPIKMPYKFQAAKELALYIYPKIQALTVVGQVDVELSRKAKEVSELPKVEQIKLLRAEADRLENE